MAEIMAEQRYFPLEMELRDILIRLQTTVAFRLLKIPNLLSQTRC